MITAKQLQTPVAAGSGITMSQGEAKGLPYWRIGINSEAQVAMFGRALDAAKDALVLRVDPAARTRHILEISVVAASSADGVSLEKAMRGSVGCKLVPWGPVASGKRPAEGLPVILATGSDVASVKLPEWARPPLPKPGQGQSLMGD